MPVLNLLVFFNFITISIISKEYFNFFVIVFTVEYGDPRETAA